MSAHLRASQLHVTGAQRTPHSGWKPNGWPTESGKLLSLCIWNLLLQMSGELSCINDDLVSSAIS